MKHRALVYVAVCALTLLAALLRFPRLNDLPPGLYHDEAYNGLDALSIGEGYHPIFFPANNGREPLYIYLVGLTVRLFGRTPLGIRAASALLGTLLVPLVFALGKEMFDERVGLWAALTATPHIWLLCLSRTGFRAGSLAVFAAAGLTALWRGRNTRRWHWFILGGALLGLAQYTYTSARLLPIALGLGLLLTRRRWQGLGRQLILFLVCMVLVALPLAVYAFNHPEIFLMRPQQVSIFNPAVHHGHLLELIGSRTLRHLEALFLMGDTTARHNVPGRPMLDVVASLLFAVGLVAGIISRARPETAFALGWIATMLLPGVLAEGGPDFLRLVGVLPLILLVSALGAAWLWRWLRSKKPTVALLLPVVLAASGAWNVLTYYDYFAHDKTPFYRFEVPSTEIAAYANCFLGHGYVRDDLPPLPAPSGLPRSVYVADELLHFSETVAFLLQPDSRIHSLGEAPAANSDEERLLLMLPTNYVPYLYLLPSQRQIEVHVGSMMQGELPGDPPFLLYLVFTATRLPDMAPVARCEDGISLLDYRLTQPGPGTLDVQLRWRADSAPWQDYTVFVHLLQASNMVGQHDGPPADGYYPTSLWRANDVIVDTHRLALSAGFTADNATLQVGLYRPENLTRLLCTSADDQTQDSLTLPLAFEQGDE